MTFKFLIYFYKFSDNVSLNYILRGSYMQKTTLENPTSKETTNLLTSQKTTYQSANNNSKFQACGCTHMDIDGITVYFQRQR